MTSEMGWPSLADDDNPELALYDDLYAEAAREHPADLGDYILGLEPKPFHREWHDRCLEHDRVILFAPIEYGKSMNMSVVAPLWHLGRTPDVRLLLVSNTAGQAIKWLSVIKANVENNPLLRRVYPDLRREERPGWPATWHDDKIIIQRSRKASLELKDYSVQAIGQQGKILGARIDGAILDDVLDQTNTMTPTMRQKVIDWYLNVLVGRIVRGGFIWIIGTAWHEDDLAHYLARKMGHEYHVARYQADVVPCLWPERWPRERLDRFAREVGTLSYNRQMLNIPFGASSQFIPMAKVERCQELCADPPGWWSGLEEVDRKRFSWVTAGVDLGMSRTAGSAETAIFVLGRHEDGYKHVLHIRSGLWIGTPILRQMLEVQRAFRVDEWLVETNAAQLHIAQMAQDRDVLAAIHASPEEASALCVYGQFTGTNRNDERWGIRGLGPEFEAEKWRVPRHQPKVEEWKAGLRVYSPFEHPADTVVAGWLANCRMMGLGDRMELVAESV